MSNLTAGQQAFIDKMKGDEEFANWGFETLASREDRLKYFEPLIEKGMFDSTCFPTIQEGGKEGTVRIPFWHGLAYLESVAKEIGIEEDLKRAELMIGIVRDVSHYAVKHSDTLDNYRNWYSFVIILASLPLDIITEDDISLIDIWLDSKFDSSLVGAEIGKLLLPKLLGDDTALRKAVKVVESASKLKFVDGEGRTAIESYWFEELFEKNAQLLGAKCGLEVLPLLRSRIDELAGMEGYRLSYYSLPAIEDHEQNKHRTGTMNDLIIAYRDVMQAFIQSDPEKAKSELDTLLQSEVLINRRLAYHFIDIHFELFEDKFWGSLKPNIFVNEVHHELYLLLENHFSGFSDDQKKRIYDAIVEMPQKKYETEDDDEALRYHKMDQRHWLISIKEKGYEKADELFEKLSDELGYHSISEHPEFLTYSSSSIGFGSSKYSADELKLMLRDSPSELIQVLNAFKEESEWKGPTIRAQADALTIAVKEERLRFIDALPEFLRATPPYQYAMIVGIKDVWESNDDIDWKKVLGFCEAIVESEDFWVSVLREDADSTYTSTPRSSWIPSVIADLIRSGLTDDEHAIDPSLMPQVKKIMVKLLNESISKSDASDDDPMSTAINSRKGRCLELLFSFALRSARIEDKELNEHTLAWETVEPIFSAELELCKDGNFEFSTLCGCYLPSISYLNKEWLQDNLSEIFSDKYESNFRCAVSGTAYTQSFYENIYAMLKDSGVIKKALVENIGNHYVRKRFVQLIGVAYLNEIEFLDDPESLISLIVEGFKEEDLLELIGFFWMQRNANISKNMVDRIIAFWITCSDHISGQEEQYGKLLSKLSLLAVFLTDVSPKELKLLKQVGPFVDKDYNTTFFLEYMKDLAGVAPVQVGSVLKSTIAYWESYFDSRDLIPIFDLLKEDDAEGLQAVKDICNLPNVMNLKDIQDYYKQLQKD